MCGTVMRKEGREGEKERKRERERQEIF